MGVVIARVEAELPDAFAVLDQQASRKRARP